MKRIAVPLFVIFSLSAVFAQETDIRFVSDREAPIFMVKRLLGEESANLVSDISVNTMSLELIAVAPTSITLPVGLYLMNVDGVANFNRIFPIVADGVDKDVLILGSPRKEMLYSLLTLASALALFPSIQTLAYDINGDRNMFLGVGLYAVLGSGAGLAFGTRGTILEYPHVVVQDR